MKKLTNTPHDKNFKVSLSNIEVAKEFLKIHLPRQVFKTIKLNTLSTCPNSYITPDLQQCLSDVWYIDLTTMPDEKIKKHNLIGLLEFAQKHVRDRKFLKQATETLAEVAKAMLNAGSDLQFIIKVTGLTEEEINELR